MSDMNVRFLSPEPALVILERGRIQTVYLNDREEWSFGRTDPCRGHLPDISVSSRLVSRMHGWFSRTEEEWFFTDCPQNLNGTWHNGRKITRSRRGIRRFVPLEEGDVLRIGDMEPGTPAPEGAVIFFTLSYSRKNWEGISLENRLRIPVCGDEEGNIPARIPETGKPLAVLSRKEAGFALEPVDGTEIALNGKPVTGPALLREGDRIQVRNCQFIFLENWLIFCR